MKIAVLYQKNEAPVSGGLKKPMKPGGYRDSGADIAFCLRENGMPVAVPAEEPDVFEDLDWVFPDTEAGIARALAAGADTLWLNTVLYDGHPIERFGGVYVVGQAPADAAVYDNKFRVNARLRAAGFPVVPESLVGACGTYGGPFPCILKPVRGRGSQGVVRCDSGAAFQRALRDALESGRFGDKMIAEPFLSGAEITVSVFPDGTSLPVVERFNHQSGIAPYSGEVPVAENSRAALREDAALRQIRRSCEAAVHSLGLRGLVRIDCRADESGVYRMFDFNLKPNMTAGVRPHRMNQDSLTMLAARAAGWTYFDLLSKMVSCRWKMPQREAERFSIRRALPQDAERIAEIYSSNVEFLRRHLGRTAVDRDFVVREMAEMERVGFLSCVIEDSARGACIGVLDYRPGACAYLSLLMLEAGAQGSGAGRACYACFERELLRQGASSVRIDVVDGYPGNAAPFWEKLKFVRSGRTNLEWNGWKTEAAVMVKQLPAL